MHCSTVATALLDDSQELACPMNEPHQTLTVVINAHSHWPHDAALTIQLEKEHSLLCLSAKKTSVSSYMAAYSCPDPEPCKELRTLHCATLLTRDRTTQIERTRIPNRERRGSCVAALQHAYFISPHHLPTWVQSQLV